MSIANPQADGELLNALYDPVRNDLHEVERVLSDQLNSRHAFIEELTRRVRFYHGKRIRPVLLLLSAQACGRIEPSHHVLGAVIEMIHVATLVHDDVLDDATIRRHVATVNAEWGNESSVLLGDYLFSQAYFLASTLETTLACQMIGEATNRTCEGELRQIARRGEFNLSEDEYFEIVSGKTAELISCACRLGAHFAGASRSESDAMARFGRRLGIAFQVADDLLDLVGRASETGKSSGTDWAKRKMTLPMIRYRDQASPKDVDSLRKLFESDSDRGGDALAMLQQSGVLESARRTARSIAAEAEKELDSLPLSPASSHLKRIARFIAERGY